jgi:hypothetical protein
MSSELHVSELHIGESLAVSRTHLVRASLSVPVPEDSGQGILPLST